MAKPRKKNDRASETEERLRLAIEAADIGTFEIDIRAGLVQYSAELSAMLGMPLIRSTKLQDAFARVHPDDIRRVTTSFQASLRPSGNGRLRMEFRFVRPGGEIRWMTWNGKIEFKGTGASRNPIRIIGACNDVTDRKRAEQSVRDRETYLGAILDSLPQNVCVIEPSGIIRAVNEPWLRFAAENDGAVDRVGVGANYLSVCRRAAAQGDTFAANVLEGLESLLAGQCNSLTLEYPCHSPKSQRWFALYANRLAGSKAELIISHLDISDRIQYEEQLRTLNAEVNHRTKNLFALVLSIARLTVSSTPADFAAKFAERLGALAASQDLLVLGNRQVVDMDNLVRSQLSHFRDLIGSRIQLTGPPIKVEPHAAQTIGTALHELATNAGKYGALSNAEGQVDIAWRLIVKPTAPARFEMSWTERSGPSVSEPV